MKNVSQAVDPGYYRHYKGKLYRVHFTVLHSESLEPLVVYESLYRNELSQMWARPLSMFHEAVEHRGKNVARFQKVTPSAEELRNAHEAAHPFKRNAVVYVKCSQYTGYGLFQPSLDSSAGKVDVLLENGNTWRYPLHAVAEVADKEAWPNWILRKKRLLKKG
jgi:hypothetical protein